MSNLVFEGEINHLNNVQSEFVKSILEERGYKNGKVIIEPLGKLGDNYHSKILRFIYQGHDEETFKMVAKVAPQAKFARNLSNVNTLFQNEHVVYTHLFPKFEELQKNAGVPQEDMFRHPACYGSYTKEPNEIILLEDLSESKFVMVDRQHTLSDESMRLALKDLAVYHSLSFALRAKDPEAFKNISNKFNTFWKERMIWKVMFYFMEADIISILDDKKYKKIVKGKITKFPKRAIKVFKCDSPPTHAVIQHGDLWTNNIMFTIENNKPISSIMIDYQNSIACIPTADLVYLIFNCSDYETRSKYYYEWIDYYYSELDKSLAKFDCRAETLYPRHQLETDLRNNGKVMLGAVMLFSNILLRESEDGLDMNSEEGKMKGFKSLKKIRITSLPKEKLDKFKDRIEGLISSFIEYEYL